jgi:hypothetical protein
LPKEESDGDSTHWRKNSCKENQIDTQKREFASENENDNTLKKEW